VAITAVGIDVVRFYERFGFIPLDSDPNRLILPFETYLKARG
jgi:hypothetical protein